jgi:hypothetical protein
MEKNELLDKFNSQLDAYAKVRGFIEKAKTQTDKFRPEVIEKVCLTHEVRSMELAETVLPLVADMETHIASLQSIVSEVEGAKGGSGEALEEMELRLAIGELSEKEFEKESKTLKEELEQADGKIAGAQEELEAFRGGLDKWVKLANEAGHATGATSVADAQVEVVAEEASLELEANAFGDEEEGEALDLASGFGEGEVEVAEAEVKIEAEPELADEPVVEVSTDDELDPHEDSGVPGASEEDFLEGEELVADAPAEGGDGETASANGAGDRRALLLYQEGTAEEQIYPFTHDEMSIGRGRDNEIQIKNDSKVSRKHCILFRENDAFFIKDNKSSNGSLVNGELITERRLFGGEEIIIGETFFRFRIMD